MLETSFAVALIITLGRLSLCWLGLWLWINCRLVNTGRKDGK
jgi:hypothetical protein